jgi:hypothetical protein
MKKIFVIAGLIACLIILAFVSRNQKDAIKQQDKMVKLPELPKK